MLDNKGFDLWADSYDKSIAESKGYPFEGYYDLLEKVHDKVEISEDTKILDIGIGTGALTRLLYKKGAHIYGVDFSEKMLQLAKKNMPGGTFCRFDFKNGLPEELKGIKFDYIVSSYALHHITDKEKIAFIIQLEKALKKHGKIIIGDVAFETEEKLEKVKKETETGAWDNDEYYMVSDKMIPELEKSGLTAEFERISMCAGILEIYRE